MIDYELFFKNLMINLNYEYSFEEFLIKTCGNKEWATEINILSIAILLNRTIYIYNPTNDMDTNIRHKFTIKDSDIAPILVGLCESHFFPVLINNEILSYTKKCRDVIFLKDQQVVSLDLYETDSFNKQ